MPTFSFSNNVSESIRAMEAESTFSSSRARGEKLVFVDLDDEPAKANVLREGKLVPSVVPEKSRVLEALGELSIVRPTRIPRVLNQNIEPGVRVAVGTSVDLVMAPRDDVTLDIFNDMHIATADLSIGQFVERIEKSNELVNLSLKYDKAAEVSATDKARISELLVENADIQVDDTVAGQGFEQAFNSVLVALAFK